VFYFSNDCKIIYPSNLAAKILSEIIALILRCSYEKLFGIQKVHTYIFAKNFVLYKFH
jgi:hypothetical protein